MDFGLFLGTFFFKKLYKPFVIALNFGRGKPEDLKLFLTKLIDEMNDILQNGIELNNNIFNIKFMGFVCNIPARCFLENIREHTGFNLCDWSPFLRFEFGLIRKRAFHRTRIADVFLHSTQTRFPAEEVIVTS